MRKFVLIVSHGSREKSANREFEQLTRKYRALHRTWDISHAYLDVVRPTIFEALESLALRANPGEILVLPFFLFSAKHVKKDIPEILKTFRKKYPRVKVRLAKPLGPDSKLLAVLDQRIQKITS